MLNAKRQNKNRYPSYYNFDPFTGEPIKKPLFTRIINWCRANRGVTIFYIVCVLIIATMPVTLPPLICASASVVCGDSSADLANAVVESMQEDPAYDANYMPELVANATYEDGALNKKGIMEKSVYGMLPHYVDEILVENGWKVIFIDGDVNGNKILSDFSNWVNAVHEGTKEFYAVGKTWWFKKEICVEATSTCLPDSTILHEIGHAIDAQCGWLSHDPRFSKVCARVSNETHVWNQLQERVDIEEKFANTFAFYLMYPDRMETEAPEMFSWFMFNIGRAPRHAKLDVEEPSVTLIEKLSEVKADEAGGFAAQQESSHIMNYEEYYPKFAEGIKFSHIGQLVGNTPDGEYVDATDDAIALEANVLRRLSGKVPPWIDMFVTAYGWSFEVVDITDVTVERLDAAESDDGNTCVRVSCATKSYDDERKVITITVNGSGVLPDLDAYNEIINGIGHIIDVELGYPSCTNSFDMMLEKRGISVEATPDATKTRLLQEKFEGLFLAYLNDSWGMSVSNPNAYEWFANIVGDTGRASEGITSDESKHGE